MMYHRSVLLDETIKALAIRPGGIYVDATFGGGGHSLEILKHLENGVLLAFDQDEEANNNKPDDPRLIMVNNNFRYLRNLLKFHNLYPVDGILADLGISSHQIDQPSRGFSTRHDGVLDMRMDRRKSKSARDIVNGYDEAALRRLFREFGELKNAARLASGIVKRRQEKPIETTLELKSIAEKCAERGKENKFFAQLFQALRIEVNQELVSLTEFLKQASEALKPGGRLAVISYHSLEDKLVKNFFRSGNFEGEIRKDFFGNVLNPLTVITRKAIVPGEAEIRDNSRSRSARLRVAEKAG
jgi:16S rRNA (cytosine1402-N4)-methyltransferase